jgi:hypothetical protein
MGIYNHRTQNEISQQRLGIIMSHLNEKKAREIREKYISNKKKKAMLEKSNARRKSVVD